MNGVVPTSLLKRLAAMGYQGDELIALVDAFADGIAEISDVQGRSKDASMDVIASELVRRRSKDAARKREERAKKKAVASKDSPRTEVCAPIESSSKKVSFEEKKKREGRGSRITDDWRPSELAIAHVKQKHSFSDEVIHRQVDRMRNHFLAKTGQGATSTNWDRNFYNWMDRTEEWNGNGRQLPERRGSDPKPNAKLDVARKMYERVSRTMGD